MLPDSDRACVLLKNLPPKGIRRASSSARGLCGWGTGARALGVQAGGAAVDALAPFGELGRVQAGTLWVAGAAGHPGRGRRARRNHTRPEWRGARQWSRSVGGWRGLVHTVVLAPDQNGSRGPKLSHLIVAHRVIREPSCIRLCGV